MSLFENPEYRWRETFLVLFQDRQRPSTDAFRKMMEQCWEQECSPKMLQTSLGEHSKKVVFLFKKMVEHCLE